MNAWQQLAAGYMFEWLGRWPLIAVLLAEKNDPEARAHARVLLDERQQRQPPLLEKALEATVQAADAGDYVAVRAHLESVARTANDFGYL